MFFYQNIYIIYMFGIKNIYYIYVLLPKHIYNMFFLYKTYINSWRMKMSHVHLNLTMDQFIIFKFIVTFAYITCYIDLTIMVNASYILF